MTAGCRARRSASTPTSRRARARACADDVLDGLTRAVQGAPAQALLRRPRLRAVRPHLRAARVLPDAHRAGDPRGTRRGDRRARPAPASWSSSAPAPPRRRACCSTRWTRPGTLGATCRSTSPSAWCARRAESWSTSTRGCACTASSATSSATSTRAAARRPAAAHRRVPRRHDRQLPAGQPPALPARVRGCWAPATTAARHRPRQGPGDASRPPTTTRPASPPSSTATCCASSTASWTPTSTPRPSSTSRSSTAEHEWIEMRLRARRALHGVRRATSTCRSQFAAGEELRTEISAKFTPERLGARLRRRRAGAARAGYTDPDELFALTCRGPARITSRAMQIEEAGAIVSVARRGWARRRYARCTSTARW